jgi:subtilisin family serine protease
MTTITINGITVEYEEIEQEPPPQKRGGPKLRGFSASAADPVPRDEHILIHTRGPLTRPQREELVALGVELLESVAQQTFLVHCQPAALDRVKALEFVEWTAPYSKQFKIHANLRDAMQAPRPKLRANALAADSAAPETREVDVLLHQDAGEEAIAAIAAAAGVTREELHAAEGKVRLNATPAQLERLTQLPDVRHIELVPKATLSNDVATRIIAADVVHEKSKFDGAGQIIAIADTGFDRGSTTDVHPAFSDRVQRLYALGRPDNANDPDGHGTHVAGSIAGQRIGDNGNGIRGAAPAARLVVQSLIDNVNGLSGIPFHLAQLLAPPYDNDGARVHNDSWTLDNTGGAYVAAARELDEFVWKHRDMIVCVAAGNRGRDASFRGVVDAGSVQAPGTAKNCITVGASESVRPEQSKTWSEGFPSRFAVPPIGDDLWANSAEGMAAFSGRGPTKDGRIKPDVVAPGTSILSTASRGRDGADRFWGTSSDPLYCYKGGTSMATPLVSGCAAIIRQWLIADRAIPRPSAALVKALLINGAVALNGQYQPSECGPRPSFNQGFGRVNLARSLGLAAGEKLEVHDEGTPLDGAGDEQEFRFDIPAQAKSIAVTLVWTDMPGERLVNDLDLIVRAGGAERHGNMPADSTTFDRVNNVEEVLWLQPPPGSATVVVRAYDVALTPQSFALVIRVSE